MIKTIGNSPQPFSIFLYQVELIDHIYLLQECAFCLQPFTNTSNRATNSSYLQLFHFVVKQNLKDVLLLATHKLWFEQYLACQNMLIEHNCNHFFLFIAKQTVIELLKHWQMQLEQFWQRDSLFSHFEQDELLGLCELLNLSLKILLKLRQVYKLLCLHMF